MNCLVTGGCGFIGSHLVDKLVSLGHNVAVIDFDIVGRNYSQGALYFASDVCNILNGPVLSTFGLDSIDYIFHLAASVSVEESIEKPFDYYQNNVMGTAAILEYALRRRTLGDDTVVVFSSTSAIYGDNPAFKERPVIEQDRPRCLSPYASSKLAAEDLCKMYFKLHGVPTVCLRYFNVYGEGQHSTGSYAPVIGKFLKQKEMGQPLTIVGDGSQSRDFIHVSDVVNANISAATELQLGKCLDYPFHFNIGTGVETTVKEVADMISPNQGFIPQRKGGCARSVAAIDDAQEVFNFCPTVQLKDWINSQITEM